MSTKAHGRILFWEGASLWILSAPPGARYPKTDPHAHHAIQVTVALTGRVDFDLDDGPIGGEGAIVIAPDVTHAFEGTGLVAHLFVASDGQVGRQIMRALLPHGPTATLPMSALGDLPARLRATFEDPHHEVDDLKELGRALVARLTGEAPRLTLRDPRIQKTIAWVSDRLHEEVSLDDVAALVRLSPGRARHLFVQETGLPFRTFVLWLRLTRALERFASGASLTDAAHDAGFSDSAHLSRTFRRMFGIAAASLRLS
ncbi:MAG: helix-turn-helix transcriptional regulator [Deltaproteobacteria bacterium]|nr:helix-turn-helix transcriptional regulator [Deltaproteobacteria bacterium]